VETANDKALSNLTFRMKNLCGIAAAPVRGGVTSVGQSTGRFRDSFGGSHRRINFNLTTI